MVVGQTDHSTQDTYSPVGSKKRLMYWSWLQSTGADMRKYLTIRQVSKPMHCAGVFVYVRRGLATHTVVYLLQCDHRVCRQALLRILVKKESFWCYGPLLRRRHRRVLVVWVHVGAEAECDRPSQQLRDGWWAKRGAPQSQTRSVGAGSGATASVATRSGDNDRCGKGRR